MRPPQSPGGDTRRDFLKATAGAAATLSALPISGVHAGGSGTIKVGLIGCGDRGKGAAIQSTFAGPDVRLVALADLFPDRLETARAYLKAQLGDRAEVPDDGCLVGFEAYKEVIARADVVLIACASKFHPMYAEAAVAAGKNVFVEKPHGIDPVGVRRMKAACDLAKTKNLSVVSGLQSRFHEGYRQAVARIHDGAIGQVLSVQSMFLRGPYRLNPRESNLTETESQFRNWYHFRWLSGDDVTQSLVHNLDRVSWILREEMPTWAFGLGGRSASFGEVYGDMFDHHTAVYEYASGARVYALCRTQNGCYGNSSDIVTGSKGTCHLGHCRIDGATKWKYDGPPCDPYFEEQKALIDAVRSGRPINSGYHMGNSTLVAILGQMACYSGVETTWDDALKSDLQFGPAPDEASFATPPPTRPDATGNYPLPIPGVTKMAGTV
jgi:predicted dehydrogenase